MDKFSLKSSLQIKKEKRKKARPRARSAAKHQLIIEIVGKSGP